MQTCVGRLWDVGGEILRLKKRASGLCAKASCFIDFSSHKTYEVFWLAFHDRITFQAHTFAAPPPSFLPFLTRAVGREEGGGQLAGRWGSPRFKRQHNLDRS